MKILVLTPYMPSPPRSGGQRRLDGLMRGLARRHEVSLLSLSSSEHAEEELEAARAYCSEVIAIPHQGQSVMSFGKRVQQFRSMLSRDSFEAMNLRRADFQARLDQLCADNAYDLVQVEFCQMGIYRFSRRRVGAPLLVLDEHNIEYDLVKRFAEAPGELSRKLYNATNWRKLKREEVSTWRRFDGVVLTSARDDELLRSIEPQTRTAVVPNAVDLDEFAPNDTPTDELSLLFFGALDYYPNIDGVTYFLDEIFPLIRRLEPRATIRVLGRNPPPSIKAKEGNGVEITGFVEDPRPLIDRATAVVVPLRSGGGTRFKIVEAMSKGKAIVSTTIGAEGLDVEHEKNLLLADDAESFARAVERVLHTPELRAELGRAARARAVQAYGWPAAVGKLQAFYDELAAS